MYELQYLVLLNVFWFRKQTDTNFFGWFVTLNLSPKFSRNKSSCFEIKLAPKAPKAVQRTKKDKFQAFIKKMQARTPFVIIISTMLVLKQFVAIYLRVMDYSTFWKQNCEVTDCLRWKFLNGETFVYLNIFVGNTKLRMSSRTLLIFTKHCFFFR